MRKKKLANLLKMEWLASMIILFLDGFENILSQIQKYPTSNRYPLSQSKRIRQTNQKNPQEEKVDVAKIRKGARPDDDIIKKPKIKKEKGVVEGQLDLFEELA